MKRACKVSGFTIVEIVIAVLIIGVLTSILVPTLISRMGDARIASAKRDLEMICDAEERVAIDTGYYFRLYVLDDVKGTDSPLPLGLGDPKDVIDGFREEGLNAIFGPLNPSGVPQVGADPLRMFIRTEPEYNTLVDLPYKDPEDVFSALVVATPTAEHQWKGPYYTIRSDETSAESKLSTGTYPNVVATHLYDIPNDPWGNDYLLFTRAGLVVEPYGVIFGNTEIATVAPADSERKSQVFDKPTVLSLGPDGIPGSVGDPVFGRGDDLFRAFGY